jgi:hypothetical protein
MADADLDPGDILVTVYTDPSWSPVLVTIGGAMPAARFGWMGLALLSFPQ